MYKTRTKLFAWTDAIFVHLTWLMKSDAGVLYRLAKLWLVNTCKMYIEWYRTPDMMLVLLDAKTFSNKNPFLPDPRAILATLLFQINVLGSYSDIFINTNNSARSEIQNMSKL